jgi:hypothetical protein
VIADEREYSSTGFRGLAFETAQEINGPARLRTAIDHVTSLHQIGVTGGPAILLVNDGGNAQDSNEFFISAVNVPYGNDAANVEDVTWIEARLCSGGTRQPGAEDRSEEWQDKTTPHRWFPVISGS